MAESGEVDGQKLSKKYQPAALFLLILSLNVALCARAYRAFSRSFHSALKRQLKAEKKTKEKEAKFVQQPENVSRVSTA